MRVLKAVQVMLLLFLSALMVSVAQAQSLVLAEVEAWLRDADRDNDGVNDLLSERFGSDDDGDGVPDALERQLVDDWSYTAADDSMSDMFRHDGNNDNIADILNIVGVSGPSQSIRIVGNTTAAIYAQSDLVEVTLDDLSAISSERLPGYAYRLLLDEENEACLEFYNVLQTCGSVNLDVGLDSFGLDRLGSGHTSRIFAYGPDGLAVSSRIRVAIFPAFSFDYGYLAPAQDDSQVLVRVRSFGGVKYAQDESEFITLVIEPPGSDFKGQLVTPAGSLISADTLIAFEETIELKDLEDQQLLSSKVGVLALTITEASDDTGIEAVSGNVVIGFKKNSDDRVEITYADSSSTAHEIVEPAQITLNFENGNGDGQVWPDLEIETVIHNEDENIYRDQRVLLTRERANLDIRAWLTNRRQQSASMSIIWNPLPIAFSLENSNPIEISGSNSGLQLGTPEDGVYTIRAQAKDRLQSVNRSATVRVMSQSRDGLSSELSANQDLDFFADGVEGYGDDDDDGIVNYLDFYTHSAQVLPLAIRADSSGFAPVLRAHSVIDNRSLSFRQGRIAQASGYAGAIIEMAALGESGSLIPIRSEKVSGISLPTYYEDEDFFNHESFGILDFEVQLPQGHDQAAVVWPLLNPVASGQVDDGLSLRWYLPYTKDANGNIEASSGGWSELIITPEVVDEDEDEEAVDQLVKAYIAPALADGFCPQTESQYERDLSQAQVNDACVYLILKDGYRGDDLCMNDCSTEQDRRIITTVALASGVSVSNSLDAELAPITIAGGCSLVTTHLTSFDLSLYAWLLAAFLGLGYRRRLRRSMCASK